MAKRKRYPCSTGEEGFAEEMLRLSGNRRVKVRVKVDDIPCHWNYRAVYDGEKEGLSLREVHYNRKGKEIAMDAEPQAFKGFESTDELIVSLLRAMLDLMRGETFFPPKEWGNTTEGEVKGRRLRCGTLNINGKNK